MTISLERAAQSETELKAELHNKQQALMDITSASHAATERLKQVKQQYFQFSNRYVSSQKMLQLQKQLANSENEKRVITERLEATHQNLAEMRRNNQILQDQVSRLNTELANNEVQKSGLESQLRLAQWPADAGMSSHHEEELRTQLHSCQRDKTDLKSKVDALNNKVRFVINLTDSNLLTNKSISVYSPIPKTYLEL